MLKESGILEYLGFIATTWSRQGIAQPMPDAMGTTYMYGNQLNGKYHPS